MKTAPAKYLGQWPLKPDVALWNLTETVSPLLVKGSTVTEATLKQHGFTVPERKAKR